MKENEGEWKLMGGGEMMEYEGEWKLMGGNKGR